MRYYVTIGKGEDAFEREIRFEEKPDGKLIAHVATGADEERTETSVALDFCILERGKGLHLMVGDESHDLYLEPTRQGFTVHHRGGEHDVAVVDERELLARSIHDPAESGRREIRASMPGIVVSIEVTTGDAVSDGQTLLVLEAMKMQNPIAAEGEGAVDRVHVAAGQAVAAGDLLVTLG